MSRSGGARQCSRSRSADTSAPAAGMSGANATTAAAEPRAKLSRRALGWALEALVVAHLSMARIAEALGVSWNSANPPCSTRDNGC